MPNEPIKLGDKLLSGPPKTLSANSWAGLRRAIGFGAQATIIAVIVTLPLWWNSGWFGFDRAIMLVFLGILGIVWLAFRSKRGVQRRHFLLTNDRQGFMRNLRLDAKTAIFDGSNIYHLGRDNGLDAQILGDIVNQLRAEGYRIVCFFDANIYFILSEHGAFQREQRHSVELLEDIFGLRADEIYVMPSGVQADRYILDSLKHLPISFAVTNDRFRDYATEYSTVMSDDLWRKGVTISDGAGKLLQHRRQNPI